MQPGIYLSILELEIWIQDWYNLFSAYLACIKGVEVLAVFFEVVVAMKSWVTKYLFLVAIAAMPCGFLLASTLAILL